MRLVLQRVTEAYVAVDDRPIGSIAHGLVVFLCIEKGDNFQLAEHYAAKVTDLRIFSDSEGKMNLSIREVAGEILLISQFTLSADAEKGRRPSFDRAEDPEKAERLYDEFARLLREEGVKVVCGVFQAYMQVGLVNDGPVTMILGDKSAPTI